MEKITQSTRIITLLLCLTGFSVISQSLVEISIEQQIEQSSSIIEGKVISQNSFWDANHRNIYTRNTVEVYKVFKGEKVEYIDVITLGGVVDLVAQISSHSLQLRTHSLGVFMLHPARIVNLQRKGGNKEYEAYSGIQGFYKYDVISNNANNVFKSHKGIEDAFYNKVQQVTQKKVVEIKKKKIVSKNSFKNSSSKAFLPVGITNISPTTIIAGEKAQLTITGSDFGNTAGTVSFSDADDGGGSFIDALASEIVSWNNTSIVVEVPASAGTGLVRVTHNSDATSATFPLTISHAEINVIPPMGNTGFGNAYQVQHINDNGSGGYTWEMFTDFFNDTAAKSDFEWAIDTWRCETKINWDVSSSATTVDVVGTNPDDTNVVRFDNGNELEAGVLGRCTSWYSGCLTGATPDINWFVSEMDIVFDDGVVWNFGSGSIVPPDLEYDFRSVILHELGHGHQLGHVIDTSNDIMHYNIMLNEEQRVPNVNNIAGGNSVQDRSTVINPCPNPVNPPDSKFPTSVMTDSSTCNLSVDENELDQAISIFPNPSNGQFYIKNASFINLQKAVVYDLSGRLISEHDLSNSTRTKTINVIGVSKGIYFVNIFSENASITRKIILK